MRTRMIARVAGALIAANVAGAAAADIPAVQHVVIVFQENRTPDNLFHGLPAVLPGADIADSGKASTGQIIPLAQIPLAGTFDTNHSHLSFNLMYDNGMMDGADLIRCVTKSQATCPPYASFSYVNPADDAPYFSIAVNYGFANRMFQSNQGPSLPAHQFIISGTSQPTAVSLFFAEENTANVNYVQGGKQGCDAGAAKKITLIGPDGMTATTHPCFDHATLTDLIDSPPAGARQGLTWRYYTPNSGGLWSAPDVVRHMCQPSGVPIQCTGPDWSNGDIVLNPSQVLTDIQQGNLASVSWVIPTGTASDHPIATDGSGPSWVASIVNAIGASPYWANTVILITWDDWGGWYDHVPPPIDPKYGFYQNGFRVPLLVVSAYTPAGYVSQATHTFGSILKFTEEAFGLPLIPPGTFADSRADDLADFFDFTQPPRTFVPISAPMGPAFFLNDRRPPTDPDTD